MQFTNRFRRAARCWAVLLAAAACVGQGGSSARADLIGYTSDANTGDLFRINFGTGAATRIGTTGIATGNAFADLAFSNDGTKLYGISQIGGSIYSINTATGAATLVNGDIDSNQYYSGLSFAPNGNALITNFDTTTTVSRVNVTPPAGATTIQSGVAVGFVDAMTVESPSSILVVARGASAENLERINLINGAVTVIGSTGLPNNVTSGVDGNVTGIDFLNGTLYGINLRGDLFQFNTSTGLATQLYSQVAGTGHTFLGLGGVPEPSSLTLIAVGLACVGADRLRRTRRGPGSIGR